MKTLITILGLALLAGVNGQVAIGKATVEGSAILDFDSNTTQGIILPATENASGVGGTITFDRATKMVQLMDNTGWINMNTNEGTLPAGYTAGGKEVGTSVIIGAETTTGGADGVLILEATDKGLILPKVANPSGNIKSPTPGTICYDTVSKSVAVFNGTEWSFWK